MNDHKDRINTGDILLVSSSVVLKVTTECSAKKKTPPKGHQTNGAACRAVKLRSKTDENLKAQTIKFC